MGVTVGVSQVLIIDEQPLTRLGLRVLLENESDFRVCGEAHDMVGAIQQLHANPPHVVIADLGLNGSACGLDVIQRLHAADAHLPILVYSMLDDLHYVERSLAAGAIGFCSKRESPAVVLSAVRQVVAGNLALSEGLTSHLLSRAINGRRPGLDSGVQMLSNRELEVFALIGRGLKTTEIARTLNVSVKTIETHRLRIREKLALSDSAKLAFTAVRWVHEQQEPPPADIPLPPTMKPSA